MLLKLSLALTGLLLPYFTYAQEVSTLIPASNATYEAISWSEDGRIYTPDFVNGHLYQLHLDGSVDTLMSGLAGPLGGAFAPDGNYYFSEFGTGQVIRIAPNGEDSIVGTGFGGPAGTLVDSSNTLLYVADYNNSRLLSLDLVSGQQTTIAAQGSLNGPDGIVYAPNGTDLLVANFNNNKVSRISPDGQISLYTTLNLSANSGYLKPFGADYLITGVNSHRIWRIDGSSSQVTLFAGSINAGGMDGSISEATFRQPNGIALSPSGDSLLISDGGPAGRIRLITGLNTINNTIAPSLLAELNFTLSPNPANRHLSIRYQLLEQAKVYLSIHHLDGRHITTLYNDVQPAGNQQISWTAPDSLASGQYYCTIKMKGQSGSFPFMLTK